MNKYRKNNKVEEKLNFKISIKNLQEFTEEIGRSIQASAIYVHFNL